MTRADDNRNQNDDNYDPFAYPSDSGAAPAQTRPRDRGNNSNPPDRRNNRTLEKVVEVPGNQPRGVDTGIELRTGDQVTISASGSVTAGRRAGVVSPDGGRPSARSCLAPQLIRCQCRCRRVDWLHRSSNGQTSQPFFIGSQATFTAPVDGRLYLTVNDDNYSDNSGSFTARIVYPGYR